MTCAGTPGSMVGYHVRLDAASTRDTRLLFCTTGILLRRLSSEPALPSISHVVVDEVHSLACFCILLWVHRQTGS